MVDAELVRRGDEALARFIHHGIVGDGVLLGGVLIGIAGGTQLVAEGIGIHRHAVGRGGGDAGQFNDIIAVVLDDEGIAAVDVHGAVDQGVHNPCAFTGKEIALEGDCPLDEQCPLAVLGDDDDVFTGLGDVAGCGNGCARRRLCNHSGAVDSDGLRSIGESHALAAVKELGDGGVGELHAILEAIDAGLKWIAREGEGAYAAVVGIGHGGVGGNKTAFIDIPPAVFTVQDGRLFVDVLKPFAGGVGEDEFICNDLQLGVKIVVNIIGSVSLGIGLGIDAAQLNLTIGSAVVNALLNLYLIGKIDVLDSCVGCEFGWLVCDPDCRIISAFCGVGLVEAVVFNILLGPFVGEGGGISDGVLSLGNGVAGAGEDKFSTVVCGVCDHRNASVGGGDLHIGGIADRAARDVENGDRVLIIVVVIAVEIHSEGIMGLIFTSGIIQDEFNIFVEFVLDCQLEKRAGTGNVKSYSAITA